jgi:cell division protein FtsL
VLNQLNPAYVPLLTFMGTLLIVAVGILFNNSRVTDVKDLIKAEARVTEANLRRLEEKIEKVENLLLTRLADHDARLGRLESR